MSGGFFRGTSADQDTRFSNKQAKLLKSQKFAPELDHLVDTEKVKMEVMKPWIGRRVTELLGFEDEVLINFIYTLLEGKAVNGKEVQIQLTGFMEKNTGKFMKELWMLLLSAQQTASGVPQQFLDAKAEELQKKEADDRQILNKIEKRMDEESKELQLERSMKMDNGVEEKKSTNFDMELGSGRTKPKDLNGHTGDIDKRNGMRARSRDLDSRNRRSVSQSRSYSGERQSRSVSRSPASTRRSLSPARKRTHFGRRSRSPLDSRSPSPVPRRVGSYRRKSPSPSWRRRSVSPRRHPRSRSPVRRQRQRSPSPIRCRRLPSPVRRRRTPSPVRRRRTPSPSRHRRSPSPSRRRRSPSPTRRRRSPSISRRRRRSPSPSWRRRSPMPSRRHRSRSSSLHDRPVSPVRHHRSPSPVRNHRSPPPVRRQMRSPSPSNLQPRSPSAGHGRSRSPLYSGSRDTPSLARRMPGPPSPRRYPRSPSSHSSSPSPRKRSYSPPNRRRFQGDYSGSPAKTLKENVRYRDSHAPHRASSPRSSTMRDPEDQKDLHREVPPLSPSPDVSPQQPRGPSLVRTRSLSEERRSSSLNDVATRQRQERPVDDGSLTPQRARERNARNSSPDSSEDEEYTKKKREHESGSPQKLFTHTPTKNKQKESSVRLSNKNEKSVERSAGPSRHVGKSEKPSGRTDDSDAYDERMSPTLAYNSEGKRHESKKAGKKSDEIQRGTDIRQHEPETTKMVVQKTERDDGSDSEETGNPRSGSKEKKHKRHHKRELASDDENNDSEIEDRKEAKRRRKEEKKMRKEEKRRRREERRQRKKERRAEKLKSKDQSDSSSSDDAHAGREGSHDSDNEKGGDKQKKLEIELRNKALELYKAKKGINH